jgi:hypothetical protein
MPEVKEDKAFVSFEPHETAVKLEVFKVLQIDPIDRRK